MGVHPNGQAGLWGPRATFGDSVVIPRVGELGQRSQGHGMRPLRQMEDEGPGSPYPSCHGDGRVG